MPGRVFGDSAGRASAVAGDAGGRVVSRRVRRRAASRAAAVRRLAAESRLWFGGEGRASLNLAAIVTPACAEAAAVLFDPGHSTTTRNVTII